MRIAVVGSGYVGLVSGACFADLGHDVILVDNDERKLTALKNGQVPIHEKFLPELLNRHRGHRLTFSNDLQEAVRLSAAVFVAVGTLPTESGEADLSSVESVAREISGYGIDGYKVIIEKSTVPVYTSEWVRKIILRSGIDPESFDVASNPEFLREGHGGHRFPFPGPHRNWLRHGALGRGVARGLCAADRWQLLSARGFDSPARSRYHARAWIIVTSTKSAELIKHASTAFPGYEDFLHQRRGDRSASRWART